MRRKIKDQRPHRIWREEKNILWRFSIRVSAIRNIYFRDNNFYFFIPFVIGKLLKEVTESVQYDYRDEFRREVRGWSRFVERG